MDSNNNPDYYGSGYYFLKAIKKYGKENFQKFIVEILPLNATIKDLRDQEKWWLKHFNCKFDSNYYNVSDTNGGMGKGDKHKPQAIEKLKQKSKEQFANLDFMKIFRDKVAIPGFGREPWNKGKPAPQKQRKQNKKFLLNEISEVLYLYSLGHSASTLSKQFNCSHHTILKIVRSNGKDPIL